MEVLTVEGVLMRLDQYRQSRNQDRNLLKKFKGLKYIFSFMIKEEKRKSTHMQYGQRTIESSKSVLDLDPIGFDVLLESLAMTIIL